MEDQLTLYSILEPILETQSNNIKETIKVIYFMLKYNKSCTLLTPLVDAIKHGSFIIQYKSNIYNIYSYNNQLCLSAQIDNITNEYNIHNIYCPF